MGRIKTPLIAGYMSFSGLTELSASGSDGFRIKRKPLVVRGFARMERRLIFRHVLEGLIESAVADELGVFRFDIVQWIFHIPFLRR